MKETQLKNIKKTHKSVELKEKPKDKIPVDNSNHMRKNAQIKKSRKKEFDID